MPDNYDNDDFICPNTTANQKVFQQLEPIDQLEGKGFLRNTASTRVNEARAVHIENIQGHPDFRRNGERMGTHKARNW
jgi:hypothetical protein